MAILAFGASNSRNSINQRFAVWAADQTGEEVLEVNLNDYEMPIYSIDRERENGIPEKAVQFKELVSAADGLVISFAEHNGSYTVAFKNVLDWMSRVSKPIWSDRPVLLLSTSPGPRGGRTVLEAAKTSFPHQGARFAGAFSLPSFNKNFSSGITDPELARLFTEQVEKFRDEIRIGNQAPKVSV